MHFLLLIQGLRSEELFIFHTWQGHLRSAIGQLYFLIMFIPIVFSYTRIMKVSVQC